MLISSLEGKIRPVFPVSFGVGLFPDKLTSRVQVPQSAAAKEELEVATHRADLQFFWGLWSDLDI